MPNRRRPVTVRQADVLTTATRYQPARAPYTPTTAGIPGPAAGRSGRPAEIIPHDRRRQRPGSQSDDHQGGVVGRAAGRKQLEQKGIGEALGVGSSMVGQGIVEAAQADVDVFAAAFDQAVGIQNQRVALGEAGSCLGAGGMLGTGAKRGSVAWSKNSTLPALRRRAGGG